MSVRVNFVPLARLCEQERRRRGARWLIANAAVLLALVVVWGVEQTANHGLSRLSSGLATLEQQRAEVARRRTIVETKERLIAERLDLLAGMEHGQAWPRRLLAVVENASDDVVLTGLQIIPAARSVVSPVATARNDAQATTKPSTQPAGAGAPAAEAFALRVLGRALDHDALMTVLAALQKLDGATDARLVHATRDAGSEHGLLAFELECRIEEVSP